MCGRQVGSWIEDWKSPSLSPPQGKFVNKDVIAITIFYLVQVLLGQKFIAPTKFQSDFS